MQMPKIKIVIAPQDLIDNGSLISDELANPFPPSRFFQDKKVEWKSLDAEKTQIIFQINNFLKKYHKNLIPKMFRTWNGNNVLLRHLISKDKPENEKEIKKNLRDAIKKVSNELHNTMAVAKKSYLNSEIYTTYLLDNDKFFEFLEKNKRENGDNKTTDRILTLFLIEYYRDLNK